MFSRYTLFNFLRLIRSYFVTKIFYSSSRLIRLPIDIRNKSSIDLGTGLTTGVGCRIEAYPKIKGIVLSFGSNVQLNDYVHITASKSVKIGNNVLMASRIYISDTSHGSYAGDKDDSHPDTPPNLRPLFHKSVVIEDNVWIGENVSILPGANIGRGVVVGANSVVKGNIPAYTIAVGAPAKIIKQFNFETKRWESIKR
jgi:acetyltransferase-like isoleucine patch superfamily enzyme